MGIDLRAVRCSQAEEASVDEPGQGGIDLRAGGNQTRRMEFCHHLPAIGYDDRPPRPNLPDVCTEAVLQLAQTHCFHIPNVASRSHIVNIAWFVVP